MAHRKSGLSMAAMVTEIGLSAARVGQLVKRAEVATLSRTACFLEWSRPANITGCVFH